MNNGKPNEDVAFNAALQAIQAQRDAANNQLVSMAANHAQELSKLKAEIERLKADKSADPGDSDDLVEEKVM